MAQPIHCDAAGEIHPADTLITRIDNGDTLAWCDTHYLDVCRAILDAVDKAERDLADESALAALTAAGPVVEPSSADGPTDQAIDLATGQPLDAFPSSGESSPAGDPPAEPPTKPASGPRKSGPPVEPTPDPSVAPGPNLSPSDDPGAAGDAPR